MMTVRGVGFGKGMPAALLLAFGGAPASATLQLDQILSGYGPSGTAFTVENKLLLSTPIYQDGGPTAAVSYDILSVDQSVTLFDSFGTASAGPVSHADHPGQLIIGYGNYTSLFGPDPIGTYLADTNQTIFDLAQTVYPSIISEGFTTIVGTTTVAFGFPTGPVIPFLISDAAKGGTSFEGYFVGAAALGTVSDVPEPASWAMMVAGLAVAGGALRRRRKRIAVAWRMPPSANVA